MQSRKLAKRHEAMQCFWALQDALCCSCWHALCRVGASARLDSTALSKLSVALEQSDLARKRRLDARACLDRRRADQLQHGMQVLCCSASMQAAACISRVSAVGAQNSSSGANSCSRACLRH